MNKNILKKTIILGLLLIPFVPFLVSSSLFFPFITTKAFTWRIIVEIVFACWIVLAFIDPEYRPKKSIILYLLTAFVIAIGISDLFGAAPIKSFWSNYERMEGYITLLHLEAIFLVMGSFMKEKEWKMWWNTSLIASFLMSLYCFSQLAGLLPINQSGVRIDGTLGNAAYLGVYTLFHIFIAILFIFREKRGSILRWLYGILIFFNIIVLYNTATRGSILGFIGGVILIAILNIRNKESQTIRKVSIASIAFICIFIIGFLAIRNTAIVQNSPVMSRFANLSSTEIKTEGRSFIWPMAIKGIKDRPILGWGQENFNYVFNKYYDPKMYGLEPWFDRAHNIFLDWGVAGGVVGLTLYISLYVALLFSLWKRNESMHIVEKSVITGLLAAYFFHNLFVFDQLISYIFFIALLAYVHSTISGNQISRNVSKKDSNDTYIVAPVVIFLFIIMYYVNFKPIIANSSLINALQLTQSDPNNAIVSFKIAYNESRLGRPETVEWIITSADSLLRSSISLEAKNDFFSFAKNAINNQLDELPTDTRYRIIAGTFFSKTGFQDDALKNLNIAQTLSPGKQMVYYQLGSAYISKGDYQKALEKFKQAYDMAPENNDAAIIYLVGSIYAGQVDLANQIVKKIPIDLLVRDQRVATTLIDVGKFSEAESLYKKWIELEPSNSTPYYSLSSLYLKEGDSVRAIQELNILAITIPNTQTQVESIIKNINSGIK